jgi:hypothetical protein
MKTLFFAALTIVLFLSTTSLSQSKNPDGTSPSFHITPSIDWGNYKLSSESTELKSKFGFILLMKVPVSDGITISPFYRQSSVGMEVKQLVNNRMQSVDSNYNFYSTGLTISFYLD